MKTKIILLAVMTFLCHLSFSQNIDIKKLDTYFETLETNNKFMGSVAISGKGKIIYEKSVGYADIETGQKLNENFKFRIGSITKTFTTVLVLKAVEEKRIALEQTIETYFPTITNAEKITLNHLLYHKSGIFNFTNDENFLDWHTETKTKKEIIELISQGGSNFEPGKKSEYSNSNFVLLTYILEEIYEKSYSDLLNEKIVKPLGLNNTYLGNEINIANNECYSYTFEGKWIKSPEFNSSISNGAGAIVSTPADLTIFSDALFKGKLISKKSLAQMKTLNGSFGMGLIRMPYYEKIGLGHGGTVDGFRSIFVHFEKEKISVAITSNALNYNLNNISIAILGCIFDDSIEIPDFTTYKIASEDLDMYTGNYINEKYSLIIDITKKDDSLFGQMKGQPSFYIEATEKDKFESDLFGVVMEFNIPEKTLILKQNGQRIVFIKD
ncbi:MAG: beta-lactamase family protein [Bacteroidales bacterium]|jgi:CubicO group peptidase (beta-lactamase class C family)|nr:beta-lactamase family protein [Bacteroidales bacterium]